MQITMNGTRPGKYFNDQSPLSCNKNWVDFMRSIALLLFILLFGKPLFSAETNFYSDTAFLRTHSLAVDILVRSWKTLRDARIVKQDLDYSCSAASLATLLNQFYGQTLTEEVLLKAMDKGHLKASFEDMQRALPQFGFKAQGFASSYEQLAKLRFPVIVYLKHRKNDHFSVLRGIDENTVWLADPSLGNRTYSKYQFMKMWNTRDDKQEDALSGKFLAVLPLSAVGVKDLSFFTKSPSRQTAQATEQMAFRAFP